MAKRTPRDRAWIYALTATHREESAVTSARLAELADVSERTARDTLKTMVGADVLAERKRGKTTEYVVRDRAWRPAEDRT